jgi:hypothetical protein
MKPVNVDVDGASAARASGEAAWLDLLPVLDVDEDEDVGPSVEGRGHRRPDQALTETAFCRLLVELGQASARRRAADAG